MANPNNFRPFKSWDQVLRHAGNRLSIYYHAPLDVSPAYAAARVDGSRVRVVTSGADPFWADSGHLDRMRHRDGCTCEAPYPQLGTTD